MHIICIHLATSISISIYRLQVSIRHCVLYYQYDTVSQIHWRHFTRNLKWSRHTSPSGYIHFHGLRLLVVFGKNFQILTRMQFLNIFSQSYLIFIRGHVLSEDTYYRTITDDQKLISKRLLAKTNKLPRWGERIFYRGAASTIGFIVEESVCDLKQKIFTTNTVNINLKSLMVKISEYISYLFSLFNF